MSNSVIHMSSGGIPAMPPGRLVFGVDATASREHSWSIARDLQAKMFIEAGAANGKLNLQLIYFGGGHCRASKWKSCGEDLARLMSTISCEAGPTMIERVLQHALREHEQTPVQAVTYIGDCMEEEIDVLAGLADKLGMAGVPIHLCQEGFNATATKAFRLLALRSGGTYSTFNSTIPETVRRFSGQLNKIARLAVANVAPIGTNSNSK